MRCWWLFLFWQSHVAYAILVPSPGIYPLSPALEAMDPQGSPSGGYTLLLILEQNVYVFGFKPVFTTVFDPSKQFVLHHTTVHVHTVSKENTPCVLQPFFLSERSAHCHVCNKAH